ncbi:MAG TPA: hypothetical protein VJB98_01210 [Candidatus Paceibacterota bacterium]
MKELRKFQDPRHSKNQRFCWDGRHAVLISDTAFDTAGPCDGDYCSGPESTVASFEKEDNFSLECMLGIQEQVPAPICFYI